MRSRTVYDKHGNIKYDFVDGQLVYAAEEYADRVQTHMVTPDIKPYQSMVDGSMIQGRAQHHEHLARHNCFEVGNEIDTLMKQQPHAQECDPKGRAELIANGIRSLGGHDKFKQALNREIEHIRWNSRED